MINHHNLKKTQIGFFLHGGKSISCGKSCLGHVHVWKRKGNSYRYVRVGPETTLTPVKTPIWKPGTYFKMDKMEHVLNFTGWIELIFDTVDLRNFVIDEFNPTFGVQGS